MPSDYYGQPVESIENEHLRIDYLTQAGPRLVRLVLPGSDQNRLLEAPHFSWDTPFGDYHIYGGHRLWRSPEITPDTYVPDDQPVTVERLPAGVRLTGAQEEPTGLIKQVEVRLHPGRPAADIHNTITNNSSQPVELAAWAITQLPVAGVGIYPQNTCPSDEHGLLPNRNLTLWPYTRWQDPRLELANDYILLHVQPLMPPVKIGCLNRWGWVGHLCDGVFFCKRFDVPDGQQYPDFGCNVETYCDDKNFEVETLGPLAWLEPGQSTHHRETWEFYHLPDLSPTLEGVRSLPARLGLPGPGASNP